MPRWIAWTLLTLVSWGIWAILFRLVGDEISPAHSQAISTLGIVPVLLALALVKDPPGTTNRWRGTLLALGSGVISCLGNVACYEALNHAKAATVIPLTALYPVVTVLLAVPLLKERLNLLQWIGIGLSLSAIYLFNVPQGTNAETALASSRDALAAHRDRAVGRDRPDAEGGDERHLGPLLVRFGSWPHSFPWPA